MLGHVQGGMLGLRTEVDLAGAPGAGETDADVAGTGRGQGGAKGVGKAGGPTGGHDAPDGAPASLPRPGLCRPWRPLPPCQPELPEGGAWAVFASARPQLG